MQQIIINGGKPLNGKIRISGAKNAALPLLTASLLTEQQVVFNNVPELSDIASMIDLLAQHGAQANQNKHQVTIKADNINNLTAPYDIVRTMRASIWVLGPLLARFGKARVSLPGGCAIGTRPIDLHLEGLKKLGAEIELAEGYVEAKCKKLKGAVVEFPLVSVGATANLIMAATLADGLTVLKNAAREPEITDLANCLVSMGAKIYGIGTSTLRIEGVDKLNGTTYGVLPDRIETGTFIMASAMAGGKVELTNTRADFLDYVINVLSACGVSIESNGDSLFVNRVEDKIDPHDIVTKAYPEFPTDLQAQFMALMTIANGVSEIQETIFENRFMHAPELMRMGANIMVHGNKAMVKGVNELKPAEVMATDLRASVSLVMAALATPGQTTINRVYHIDRGYEHIVSKLQGVGADIQRS